jgi:putative ABC transport system permease protein
VRVTGSANRRLRVFAVVQIAASFLLLTGASMMLKTLFALQSARTPLDTHHVLAIDVPPSAYGRAPDQNVSFYQEAIRRVTALPGVDAVAVGSTVPWRDAKMFGFGLGFSVDGYVWAAGEDDPRARLRVISPGLFAALGVPIIDLLTISDAWFLFQGIHKVMRKAD